MTPQRLPADRWPALFALFGSDLRSLALLRVLLALTLLAWVPCQWLGLGGLYGDTGVAPRHWILQSGIASQLSLHMISGSSLFEALLIAVQTAAALCLLLGRGSRIAAIISLVLWLSWLTRYPLVTGGGDLLLAWLLLWSAWLPLGARFSFDAALSTTPPPSDPRVLTIGSAALRVNTLLLLALTISLHVDGPTRWAGLAALGLLALAPAAGHIGGVLRDVLVLLLALSVLILWATMPPAGPLYAALLALLAPLLGPAIWQWLAQRPRVQQSLTIYYDEHCRFCLKAVQLLRGLLALQNTELKPAQSRARTATLMERHTSWIVIDAQDQAHLKWAAMVALLRASPLFPGVHPLFALRLWQRPGDALYDLVARHRGRLGRITAWLWPRPAGHADLSRGIEVVAGFALIVSLLWIGASATGSAALQAGLRPLLQPWHLDTDWPRALRPPAAPTARLVISGETADGGVRNLLAPDLPVDFRSPIDPDHSPYRWQRYWDQLALPQHRGHRRWYAESLCRQANGGHDGLPGPNDLLSVQIDRVGAGDGREDLERTTLWHQDCFAADRSRP